MTRIAATDIDNTRIVLHWVSADSQGIIDMAGMTGQVALGELLSQCGSDDGQRAAVLAGSFEASDTILRRDGTVVLWDVYQQGYRTVSRVEGSEAVLASLGIDEREAVLAHLEGAE